MAGAAALAVGLLVINLLTYLDLTWWIPSPVRSLLIAGGMLALPGLPVVAALRTPGRALSTIQTAAISISVNVLAIQASIMFDWWDPVRTQTVLLSATLFACALAWRTLPGRFRTKAWTLRVHYWTTRRVLHVLALVMSAGLMVIAARTTDVLTSGPLGIIAEISHWYVMGLILLAFVLVRELRDKALDTVVLAAAVLVAVSYNTMFLGLTTGQTSVPTAFVHRGFIEILATTGELPSGVDARFSWAGFFSAGAHLQSLSGTASATGVMLWAPLVFGLLLAFGLYSVALSITGRARLAWLAVLLYQASNWYQQDYYSPQAIAVLGYTAIIATLLWQLRRAPLPRRGDSPSARITHALRRTPGRVRGFGPGRTFAVGLVLILIVAANTVTHQLTPVVTILAFMIFAFTGSTRYRTLWITAWLLFMAWFSYGAVDYWLGHLPGIVEEFGQLGQSMSRGVGERLSGDLAYQRMQYLRIGVSAVLAIAAVAGWWIWRGKRCWLVGGLLCIAPFTMLPFQSYGGEMVIRAFLFASTVFSAFAAMALSALAQNFRARSRRVTGIALVLLVTALGLLVTTNRGLNYAFEATTEDEVVITDAFIAAAEPRSRVMTVGYVPQSVGVRGNIDPRGPRIDAIDEYVCLSNFSECVMENSPEYLFIAHQGMKWAMLQLGLDSGYIEDEIDAVIDSGLFVEDVSTDSVRIFRRNDLPVLDLPDFSE